MAWGKWAGLGLVIAGCGRIGYAVPECESPPDGMIAAYSFDGASPDAADRLGEHDGLLRGANAALRTVAGPTPCGQAIAFDGQGANAWVEVPDSPDWDLRRGSVDLWVRPPSTGDFAAILTRDASGTALPGHISLFIEPDRTVWVRLQRESDTAYRCADVALAPGEWAHIGINFGAPDLELWIGGALQDRDTPFTSADGQDVRCGEMRANWGIDGNDNPWILGGGSQRGSAEGTGMPVLDFFVGGAIDELQIAPFRRSF